MAAVRSLEEVERLMTQPGAPWEWTVQKNGAGRSVRTYKTLPANVAAFWQATKVYEKRDYIVYEGERVTYGQAHELVDRYAALLHARGIRKGDRVAIAMRNLPEFILLFWAIHTVGAVVVAVNAWAPLPSLFHCINIADTKFLIADHERAQVIKDSLGEFKSCKTFMVTRPEGELPSGFEDLKQALERTGRGQLPKVDIGHDDLATIYFTSGTTSMPKGVYSTQAMFVGARLNSSAAFARAALRKGLALPVPTLNDPQKCTLLVRVELPTVYAGSPHLFTQSVPLFHVTGCQSMMQLATAGGAKIVLIRKWDADVAAKLVLAEGITTAGGVPHMALELVERVKALKGDGTHPLEGLSFGGGPASVMLPNNVESMLPGLAPGQGYGLTETNAVITSVAGADYAERKLIGLGVVMVAQPGHPVEIPPATGPTSCGLPSPVTELKIMSDSGETLPSGQTGEIVVRGPQIAVGYWKNDKATREAFDEEGWFKTGDIGYLDKDGFLHIADRAKDIIIRGGENIATSQVENALYQDSRVKDAAVVPVPDPKLSELVAAIVVLHPQHRGKVSEKQLQDSVARWLPKHCVPVMIDFRDEMPRNATGKTTKLDLKKEATALWEERQKTAPVKAKL